jgi:hypothetical protein
MTTVTLKKNGKNFRLKNASKAKCPFCKSELEQNFDSEIEKVKTEIVSDNLPKSLENSMSIQEGLGFYFCKCGKKFLSWETGDYDYFVFYEIKEED